MKAALQEALKAFAEDEVPVGAVIVKDDKIIARAHNAREKKQQSYAHAEMLAIQKASKKLGTWCLNDCDLYVTLEPCMMCMGALNLARIHTVYYGAKEEKFGAAESMISYRTLKGMNRHPQIQSGILQKDCSEILSKFFQMKREEKKKQKKPHNL